MIGLRIAAPTAALLLPAIVWAGPGVSPLFLALALAVPAVGILVVHRLPVTWPRARAVALVTIGTLPLYSLVGQLFDVQFHVGVNGLGAWMLIWIGLLLVAALERPRPAEGPSPRPSQLAFARGISAAVVTLFGVAHVTNHLAGFWDGDRHIALMATLRTVYRAPAVEAVLILAVAFQVLSGARLPPPHAERGRSWWQTAQVASGAYLGVFFVSHLTAAMRARLLHGIDTKLGVAHRRPDADRLWAARLVPMYFLSVTAFAVHAGLGLRYVLRARGWSAPIADGAGVMVPTAATLAAAGILVGLLSA